MMEETIAVDTKSLDHHPARPHTTSQPRRASGTKQPPSRPSSHRHNPRPSTVPKASLSARSVQPPLLMTGNSIDKKNRKERNNLVTPSSTFVAVGTPSSPFKAHDEIRIFNEIGPWDQHVSTIESNRTALSRKEESDETVLNEQSIFIPQPPSRDRKRSPHKGEWKRPMQSSCNVAQPKLHDRDDCDDVDHDEEGRNVNELPRSARYHRTLQFERKLVPIVYVSSDYRWETAKELAQSEPICQGGGKVKATYPHSVDSIWALVKEKKKRKLREPTNVEKSNTTTTAIISATIQPKPPGTPRIDPQNVHFRLGIRPPEDASSEVVIRNLESQLQSATRKLQNTAAECSLKQREDQVPTKRTISVGSAALALGGALALPVTRGALVTSPRISDDAAHITVGEASMARLNVNVPPHLKRSFESREGMRRAVYRAMFLLRRAFDEDHTTS